VAPWVKATLFNVFNTAYRTGYDVGVVPCDGSPGSIAAGCGAPVFDSNGLPTTFVKGSSFGTARGVSDYQIARTFTLSAGIRF